MTPLVAKDKIGQELFVGDLVISYNELYIVLEILRIGYRSGHTLGSRPGGIIKVRKLPESKTTRSKRISPSKVFKVDQIAATAYLFSL